MNKKKVLVTGSTGFIGTHLTDRLKEAGTTIFGLSRSSSHPVDIRKWIDVKRAPISDIVYHLAASTDAKQAFSNPKVTYQTNVLGTANILEYCRIKDVEKIIFASSFVYGNPEYLPIDENHPTNPVNPYMRSKIISEGLCKSFCEKYGINCIILRASNVYGLGQKEDFLIPSIMKQIFELKKLVLRDPEPKRDFLYIDDLVSAYINAGKKDGRGCEIFNIGLGKSYAVREIAEKIVKAYQTVVDDIKIEVCYTNEKKKNEIHDTCYKIDKAMGELKWRPKIDIDEGITRMVRDYANKFQK